MVVQAQEMRLVHQETVRFEDLCQAVQHLESKLFFEAQLQRKHHDLHQLVLLHVVPQNLRTGHHHESGNELKCGFFGAECPKPGLVHDLPEDRQLVYEIDEEGGVAFADHHSHQSDQFRLESQGKPGAFESPLNPLRGSLVVLLALVEAQTVADEFQQLEHPQVVHSFIGNFLQEIAADDRGRRKEHATDACLGQQ